MPSLVFILVSASRSIIHHYDPNWYILLSIKSDSPASSSWGTCIFTPICDTWCLVPRTRRMNHTPWCKLGNSWNDPMEIGDHKSNVWIIHRQFWDIYMGSCQKHCWFWFLVIYTILILKTRTIKTGYVQPDKTIKFQISPRLIPSLEFLEAAVFDVLLANVPACRVGMVTKQQGFQAREKSLQHGKPQKEHENELSNFIFQFSYMFIVHYIVQGVSYGIYIKTAKTQQFGVLKMFTNTPIIHAIKSNKKKSSAKNKPWTIKETL